MDAHARARTRTSQDLAEFVLADTERRAAQPEARERSGGADGYDPRSVVILALVVAVLAAVVAWVTSIERGGSAETVGAPAAMSTKDGTERGAASGADRGAAPTPSATTGAGQPSAPFVRGIDLQIGRVVPSTTATRSGLVRVGVRNPGTVALTAGSGARVLVLVNGREAGSADIGSIAARGGALAVDVPLYVCPVGRHTLAVIVDPSGVVREANERDNASTSSASFPC